MRDIGKRESPMVNAARLPDFIFARDPEIEQRDGLALAGKLITNIRRSGDEPTSAQRRLVEQIIESLIETAAENPTSTRPKYGSAEPSQRMARWRLLIPSC
jgi:hypothetical protein